MKIGKPMSKRQPVRLRHKIQKASAAKQRKGRKEAKKNPEWRSRLKKDPGIPNAFPYKDKILAEIEESRRRKEEEVQRRRDVAKAQRQGKAVESVGPALAIPADDLEDDAMSGEEDEIDEDENMDEADGSNPMAALLASAQARANAHPTRDDENEDDASDDDDGEDEWDGLEDTNATIDTAKAERKGLPKQAIADPIKTVSKLLERIRDASGGIQLLLDHYRLPPLFTAGGDMTSRFLVEVARKRGRLGRGGIPNLHSAALIVLGDVNDGKVMLPTTNTKTAVVEDKGEVQIVQSMAEPFKLEGLLDGP